MMSSITAPSKAWALAPVAFSLLPAQNASGNWIKIVQRLPVRIVLDPHDMQKTCASACR